ncbi:RimK family alpha-L-glutamate ligase [Candidatus Peregrinibacteria bacterium]|jgi:ribosomal protein S6--L-glutamate ligase|nr:RimK family alpha-L-glutamate ligase [Candidatus Peregrinibacteria bacterium]MBT4148024.1 RimK family alpha-L-glutamate ligase [Candidatus Peregrinibacteria bacterium]MBT4366612.1 RimK family alpha-L-glutamate ligase [Candidatus Peregrinibacteria bacterium]MBT4455599.1 RimK family alpha-L-glutamate ligase [Candidatus Peregrinibacteria bacterium]
MRIGILSFKAISKVASKEEVRLKKVAKAKGHTARIFRSGRFQLVYDGTARRLLYDGKLFPKYDVIISRVSVLRDIDLNISIIKQMEMMGIPVINRYTPVIKAKNKLKSMQIMDHYNIPIPKTAVIRSTKFVDLAVKSVGGLPVIIKSPFGSYGVGVTIAESKRGLKSMMDWENTNMYMIQEFVKFSKGKDIRVFVVGGKVVGTMMRSAGRGEFRSNIELGGKGSKVEITEEEKDIAIKAVQALDLEYAGVDILRSKEGPVVLEINANPGFKALEQYTGIDVATPLIDFAIEYAESKKPLFYGNGG